MVLSEVFGLKINLDKSTLLGINMNQDQVQALASLLDNRVLEWSISHLSLPLEGNPRTISFWYTVIERLSKGLEVGKESIFKGRITLINSA